MADIGHHIGEGSEYLAEVYARSSDAWDYFELSGEQRALADSAGLLCEGLERLSGDGAFWAGMNDIPREVEQRRAEVEEVLGHIELLLAVEERVLTRFFEDYAGAKYAENLARRKAIGLVRRAALSVASIHEVPTSAYAIEALRDDVARLRDEVCDTARVLSENAPPTIAPTAEDDQERSRFWSAVRVVGRGLFVVGGLTIIVGNGTAMYTGAITLDIGLASCSMGQQFMNQQFGSGRAGQ